MLRLREERARLLGFNSFADWKLETEMARSPGAVRDLLMQVWSPAREAAERDAVVLELMLHADGHAGPLEPWDWRYYSEKRRAAEHDLDEAEVKAFFQLDRMVEAAFDCAHRLFGLEAREVEGPRYHPDVRLWEVTRAGSTSRCSWATSSRGRGSGRGPGAGRSGSSRGWGARCAPSSPTCATSPSPRRGSRRC
jgi:peptidyl-dipeptidase Dcp